MAENGYANPVLVTTDWLAEHLNDDSVVVAEVDENPDLYDEGHIAGAVKLHWRDDLQDPVERDLVDKPTFERLLSERGIANDTTLVLYGDKNNWFAAYAYWYLKIYGHGDGRPRRRDLQERRRAPRALRGQRRHAGKRGDSVLPDRRAQRSYLVRPPRATGLRDGQELRRLVDGVGQPRRRADRKGFLAARRRRLRCRL